jgi:hypothetical protein
MPRDTPAALPTTFTALPFFVTQYSRQFYLAASLIFSRKGADTICIRKSKYTCCIIDKEEMCIYEANKIVLDICVFL